MKKIEFYKLKTNPRQKGDYGGTSYTSRYVALMREDNDSILENINITEADVRQLANTVLGIPQFAKFVYAYEDSTDKDWKNNILAEKIEDIQKFYYSLKEKDESIYDLDKYYTVKLHCDKGNLVGEYIEYDLKGFKQTVNDAVSWYIEELEQEQSNQRIAKCKRALRELSQEEIAQILLEWLKSTNQIR